VNGLDRQASAGWREQGEQGVDRASLGQRLAKVQIVFASGTGSPRPRKRIQVSRSRK
jgi:hypothetical protein